MNYQIYIGGALTHATKNLKNDLEKVGNFCNELGLKSYIPHISGTDPIDNPEVSPNQVWQKNYDIIAGAEYIIAYVGVPSLGTGAELEIARTNNTKIILWWFEGEKVSRMALGNPAITQKIEIKNINDIKPKLENIFNQLKYN